MAVPHIPDRSVLAGRIQGFGNVNPPPLEDETGTSMAKRAVSRLGDMVGEEVMLTVEDFREKGAVGAVKDAVADAGDILIDGVSGLIGWLRGDPPPAEDDSEKAEEATKALSNGPGGAAYGISQASPTGGINAVWVMPEEADPAALAQLAAQSGGGFVNDPRVPKNIQPYQAPVSKHQPMTSHLPMGGPMQLPGGPMIAPYQPAPSGPGMRGPPFVPGALPGGLQQNRWGPGGYSPSPGGFNPAAALGGGSATGSGISTGAKGLVERISKGEVLPGADVAKRLVMQCNAAKTTSKQLADIVCERTGRLYLGLDGDATDCDAAIMRLLSLTVALLDLQEDFAKSAVEEIKRGVADQLLSLRSSAKHKAEADPMLRQLGLLGGGAAKAAASVDLLGGGSSAQEADLLGGGGSAPVKEVDLLGGDSTVSAPLADLLGGSSAVTSGSNAWDPVMAPAPVSGGGDLVGLNLDTPAAAPVMPVSTFGAAPAAATLGAGAVLPEKKKKPEDAFGFVGAEMFKAGSK